MRNKIVLSAVLAIMCVTARDSWAMSAKEIIDKSERAIRGDSQISIMKITIKTRRWTRSMTVKSYENRLQKKSFSEIIAPKKDAGNRFLLIGHEMQQFVPNVQRVIKISPSMMLQSWMGSDFTNDDIVKDSSISEDYFHSNIGTAIIDGHNCYKIQLLPKPNAAVVWGKIIYYTRIADCLPVREEFYNQHNVLKKILSFGNFKKMHDRVIPTVYKMQSPDKQDRYTMLLVEKAMFNIKIPNSVFTLQNLTRR